MNRIPITPDYARFPARYHSLLSCGRVYDSSCSPEARVWFLDTQDGLYLKSAPAGTLKIEAEMARFFHSKGLSCRVIDYFTDDRDWLLTARIPGEDCTHRMYLDDPKRLCETTAQLLRQLHSTPVDGCPIPNRTDTYLATARKNHEKGLYDTSLFPDNWGYATAEEAWSVVEKYSHLLKTDTLLHGDYCLPNILLNNWTFSGFIDLGNGGVGDRHIDLFWGAWTLFFNLKTDYYRDRFLDAYGREDVEEDMFPIIAACEVFG